MSFIEEGVSRGASKDAICKQFGLSSKTLKRWHKAGPAGTDGRKGPTKAPKHKLTPEERAKVIEVANSEEFRNLSPRQIVPRLADEGRYVASESTVYRVLREEGLLAHRSHRKAPVSRKPDEHRASGPNQVWSWDITYLRTHVRGQFFYLYMAVDVWSRKIVGFRVEQREDSELSKELLTKAIAAQSAAPGKLVIHADNGGPMKAATLLSTLQRLGVVTSFSRPHVSDDNPYSEALFGTMKGRPGFPRRPFTSLDDATAWVERFVRWYNFEHLHSGIRFVTPESRHERRDVAILAKRAQVYAAAKAANPRRWTGTTRNWTPIGDVVLNPIRDLSRTMPLASAAE
jgi:transposase InsO family protein